MLSWCQSSVKAVAFFHSKCEKVFAKETFTTGMLLCWKQKKNIHKHMTQICADYTMMYLTDHLKNPSVGRHTNQIRLTEFTCLHTFEICERILCSQHKWLYKMKYLSLNSQCQKQNKTKNKQFSSPCLLLKVNISNTCQAITDSQICSHAQITCLYNVSTGKPFFFLFWNVYMLFVPCLVKSEKQRKLLHVKSI